MNSAKIAWSDWKSYKCYGLCYALSSKPPIFVRFFFTFGREGKVQQQTTTLIHTIQVVTINYNYINYNYEHVRKSKKKLLCSVCRSCSSSMP